ncbi:glycosyltransferase involved in cell wall biosynthesis [Flavobacterium cauense R2A-7]|uniref:Glycosyltransferase involved in cell wall biosynthesis n=1 Tax=Flavobacterium cauense R2A-7 TaxID=1341154 RepID=A0A562LX48_9FLAO|nr:glycosyltransferase family 4 protein [Flavobacterium cauense]KGO82847.1 glycosyl transferase [Flavobacterium cauense R2A-7]TWI12123.1 glycosyltransferase involved in cell wall biosynthesis [Flavobacterium cauense R2A-7]
MKLLIVSAAPLIPKKKEWKAYGPYVKEMEFWAKYADEIQFCCPVWESDRGLLVTTIPFETVSPVVLKEFDVQSAAKAFKSIFAVLVNLVYIAKAMKTADHIHLRCPGNIGLLGCLVQILFPNTPKTAKYAGNWDPKAKQPLSYRIQKWILSNTFLTRNMQVLVYGEWQGSTKNIKPFFTASYKESDKEDVPLRKILRQTQDGSEPQEDIRFLFVGTLSEGKRPLYAIQLVEELRNKGYSVRMDLYGEGKERAQLLSYIQEKGLQKIVVLHGNQSAETVQHAYRDSHFLLLPSKSEGWPKVVAEAMFWGCVPVASAVSCVPTMLDNGTRGVVLTMVFDEDFNQLKKVIDDAGKYQILAEKGMLWSRHYTLDYFESEIRGLLERPS